MPTIGGHNGLHGRPEVEEDQQTLDAYPTHDEGQEHDLQPERNNRQMSLTEFEEPESAADD